MPECLFASVVIWLFVRFSPDGLKRMFVACVGYEKDAASDEVQLLNEQMKSRLSRKIKAVIVVEAMIIGISAAGFVSQLLPDMADDILGKRSENPEYSKMYDMFMDAGYQISDLIRINGKYPAIVAVGTNEKLYIATLVDDYDILQNVLKRVELCFADTLEGLHIDTHVLCVTNRDFYATDKNILRFENVNALQKYLIAHKNPRPTSQQARDNFDAYAEYINTAMTYLFKK